MKIMRFLLTLLLCAFVVPLQASDESDLTVLLQDFLANSDKEQAHARFWADDLVYTSSTGARFDKATIMSGFESSDDADSSDDGAPSTTYTGEEVDVRMHGDTAVVAFKLVATPADSTEILYYFNTGTFLKRDGEWRVVAWQATKIPSAKE